MSVQAISWALEDAPDVAPGLVSTLIALANHASRDGTAAYPSTETLTAYTRKSHRQVRRDLDELAAAGLIRPGDPAYVAHIRPDRRPQVWDLATERKQPRGDTDDPPHRSHGGTPTTPRTTQRGVTHDIPQTGDGGSWVTERGVMGDRNGGSWVTPEPSLEPSMNQTQAGRPARRAARARPAGQTEHPTPAELDAAAVRPDAYRLVARWAGANPGMLNGQRRALSKAVDELLAQRADPALIPAALDEAHRPGWRDPVRSLPSAYDRARRDAHPSPPAPLRTQPRESAADRAKAETNAAFDRRRAHYQHGTSPGGN